MWACDFFTQRVWTLRGVVEVYVLFFLNVASRKAHVVGLTAHPDRAWVAQQARNACLHFAEQPEGERPAVLLRDNDRKYGPEFDAVFAAEGVRVHPVTPRSPNLNARAERFVQTIRRECLDRFVFFGEAHLRHVLREFLAWYHEARPHQALGNAPPCGPPAPPEGPTPGPGDVVCDERLGGLLRHYTRRAA